MPSPHPDQIRQRVADYSAPAHSHVAVPDAHAAIAAFVSAQLGGQAVSIVESRRLSGGAIQENWLLTALLGRDFQPRRWVLRTDAPSAVAVSMGRAQEFAVLGVAHKAGVAVPAPYWLCRDPAVIGRDFFIMQVLSGTAVGHRLVNDPALPDGQRRALCRDLGLHLARLHRVAPGDAPTLDFLPPPAAHPALASIAQYRDFLDALGEHQPVLEWGLRWCEVHAPPPRPARLIHRDYRTGNYMVDDGRLTGILDWEFTGWGDPWEDIGWFTARCWRFGRTDRVAGGMGRLDDFLAGYAGLADRRPTDGELVFWQVMAHLRWAVVALQQARRHLSGQQRSLELALTGRMVPELEQEILALTGGAA